MIGNTLAHYRITGKLGAGRKPAEAAGWQAMPAFA